MPIYSPIISRLLFLGENREQRTENREQRTENREQRTENREQRTENREQNCDILNYLRQNKNYHIVQTKDAISFNDVHNFNPDCIISYNYHHIVPPAITLTKPCINLHISFLPWNRGADPNFWSWYDDTPKGVTIHYMDEHFDTGDIILQKKISMSNKLTLAETYEILQKAIQDLFIQNWDHMLNISPVAQVGNGTLHRIGQMKKHLLINGWDTPCEYIETIGRVERAYEVNSCD
ncbi:MAG: hypothetical protein STSR0009_19000 [Methanoregula sp.]